MLLLKHTFLTVGAAAAINFFPTAVDPVNVIFLTWVAREKKRESIDQVPYQESLLMAEIQRTECTQRWLEKPVDS